MVLGRGTGEPGGLVFVGEAPGEEEERTGLPFVGRAGRLLSMGLRRAGLEPAWITNTVLHRPPGNRNPHKAEIQACWNLWVRPMLLEKRPRLLVAVGSVASRWLCGVGAEKGHGRVFPSLFPGLPGVFVMYHPARVLRDLPGMLPVFEGDLLALRAIASGCGAGGPAGITGLVCDLETTGLDPRSARLRGMAWLDVTPAGTASGYQESIPVWLPDRLQGSIWFNGEFDLGFLLRTTRDARLCQALLEAEVEDVAVMARLLQKPQSSLQALASLELGVEHGGIQDLARRHNCAVEELPLEVLAEKSLRDVELTWRLYCKYREELARAGLWETYRLERAVAPVVRRVRAEGLPLDLPYLEGLDRELAEEIDSRYRDLAARMPPVVQRLKTRTRTIPPNPRSRQQVVDYLLSQGVSLSKRTRSGALALDAEVLESVDHPFVADYARFRAVEKLRDFTRGLLAGAEGGRIYPDFHQLGAVSGRFSSGKTEEGGW
jgi:uracil-DNA glycosylase family 4